MSIYRTNVRLVVDWLILSRANGYLFFGMPGNYNDDLLCLGGPETRPLFVGIPKPEQPSSMGWYYLGTYSFSLPPPPLGAGLHVDEWNALTPKVH